ncbi:MAG: M14 metallopeptidase family protein [Mucilaginibacter sp.]
MMLKVLRLLFVGISISWAAMAQKVQSPAEFLGYKLGDQFTPHYRIAAYFNYVAQTVKNTKLQQYGTTNEGRPLLAMFIASAENINRLDEIRTNNLRLAGLEKAGIATTNAPVIVWLSYNVHGNEPSSSEAAMQTLYDLVDSTNTKTQAWLKNTVVIIDPCLNPDGRERYVNFYNGIKGSVPDANPSSREHIEPWPGGRVNHYYFDLNRDWVWQTQKETQARIALFNQWLPQIHVDFHEQTYNSPYYFAPAAEPFHRDITPWQREFQTIIGKNNAKYFDQNGWLYFTRQEFDLLYPSYGDTYPIYNGSIGMTYEQGGIGAGLAIVTRLGDTLTLAQRIAHHHSNSLSTIETASAYAQKAVEEFKKYFDKSIANPPGVYKTYIIKNDNRDKINTLAKLLDRNGIQYGFGLKGNAVGYNYFADKTESFAIGQEDMVINAYQPKSVLLNVLLEPKTFMADSNTYDITAWALPYAYGLNAFGVKESLKPVTTALAPIIKTPPSANAYAYICAWQSVNDAKFLAALLKENIRVRYTETPFEVSGKKFAAGSLIITRAGNGRADFNSLITRLAAQFDRDLTPLQSGFVDKGADFGSDNIKYIHPPKILLVSGDGTNSEAVGQIWHFFEQEVHYPVTVIRYNDLDKIKLNTFDVAIFPDGKYDDFPSDKLQAWVRDGGKMIALENAVEQLADKKVFDLKNKEEKKDDKNAAKPAVVADRFYENRDNEVIKSNVSGAIYKINLDNTHPLGFGMPKYYYTLKQTDNIYELLTGTDNWNVGTIKTNNYVAGFVGQKGKDKIKDGLLIGIQKAGKGSVIYMVDDPLFRNFWEGGKLLFSNAVFIAQ